MMRAKTLQLGLVLGLASLVAAEAAAADVRVSMTAPRSVAVGDTFALEVTVENRGDEAIIVKEPMHDYRSFDFEVAFEGGARSLYTKYHPRAGEPSPLRGQDLAAGATLSFRHEVSALEAGKWAFTPLFHGAGGTVEGERQTVEVTAKDGATRALLELRTGKGVVRARFWPDVAPATSLHLAELARTGFYDGLVFHRTLRGFMIQGGCPEGTGGGGPGHSIEAEFNRKPHVAGVLSMARVGDPYERMGQKPRAQFANSAGSQFFVCDATASSLDGKYTAFGKVVEGLDVVHAIAAAPVVTGPSGEPSQPVEPVRIEKASLVLEPAKEVEQDGAAGESPRNEESDG